MRTFARLPFDEQLARIDAAKGADDATALRLLRAAGDLPDSEPLARLVSVLAGVARMKGALLEELVALSAKLSDPALQHLLDHTPGGKQTAVALRTVVTRALGSWPIARISAIAFLSRWLRRRFPADYEEFQQSARERLKDDSRNTRWLLFASGAKLQELSLDPAWRPLIADAVSEALQALANAPKSISQANAESLLARRVYADPGHFFFELLQNADDAGAGSWRASISSDGVTVEHDGEPLSFYDVVGLLSIGQTTKRKDQIGFFGVGFKSVYEICQRPRFESGIFNFEIAHVSIPRSVSDDSTFGRSTTTSLELPYSSSVDVPALFGKATAIPPETLLTLPNVRALAVSREPAILGDDDATWAWEEEWDDDVAILRRVGGDEVRRYRCAQREFAYPGAREVGRADTSPVLIAVALEQEGEAPRPTRGPTLYSFLPTAQHTGLRCMVHARFDVTLDRERLEQDSAWNETLLGAAGAAFAELVGELAEEGHAVLPILSAPSELTPVAAPFAAALKSGLRDCPCLPGAGGVSVRPSAGRIVAPELCSSLAGLDLGGAQYALAPLRPREQELAQSLGATAFTNADLLLFAGETLIAGSEPPPWVDDAVRGAIGDADVPDAELQSVALLVDGGGALQAPRNAMEAPTEWATLYASIKPVVGRAFLRTLPVSLRARVNVRSFDTGSLEGDLRDAVIGPVLLAREEALLLAVSTLSSDQLATLTDAEILRTSDGSRRAVSDGLYRLDPVLASLRDELDLRVSLVAADISERHPELVAAWVPAFGLPELARLLPRRVGEPNAGHEPGDDAWSDESLDAVVGLLNGSAGALSRDLAKELSASAIFRDTHGARRPLHGPQRILIPADPALRTLFPTWPWASSPAGAFIEGENLSPLGAADVAEVLTSPEARPARAVVASRWAPALLWLSQHADHLSARELVRLSASRIWLDADGHRRLTEELRLPTRVNGDDSGEVEAFFRAMGKRSVAHAASIALAAALGASERIPPSDASTAIGDLLVHGLPSPASEEGGIPSAMLAALLNEATSTLSAKDLAGVLDLAVFRDTLGERRSLASWAEPKKDACHRPGALRSLLSAGALPLLCEEDEVLFAKFLYAFGPAPATSADLVRCLHNDEALLRDPGAVRQVLSKHAGQLSDEARDGLRGLALFDNEEGVHHAASALCSREELSAFLSEHEVAELGLGAFLIDVSQEGLVHELELPLRPTRELIEEHLLGALVHERALGEQRAPWNSPSSLARLHRLAHHAGISAESWPLALDTGGLVTAPPLAEASEATRGLCSMLSIEARFADPGWAALLSEEGRSELLSELPLRRVTAALQGACPDELPIEGHPVLQDTGLVFDWLMEKRVALEEDEAALASLSAAAILPSQKRTFRCPRDLVLDPSIPELGLSWGISREVPELLAQWMARTFELDRRQRRNVIEHVLSGLDAAAEDDDAARATELISFLASALQAPNQSAEGLAERATHTKVKARLRVPLRAGGWGKARRARLGDASADLVDVFCSDPPDRIALGPLDAASRALLLACGATEGLSTKTVRACLNGEKRKPGAAAHLALARYVALHAAEKPRLRHEWQLDKVSWVPNQAGTLAKTSELLWPDELAGALIGDSPERFPAQEFVLGLPEEAASALGFKRASELTLGEVAAFVRSGVASPELLDWLEEGLQAKRFLPAEVRNTFVGKLRLRDDSGAARFVGDLALDGARALFGPRRGDFSAGARVPLLSRALLIPRRPNAAMILSFLEEVTAEANHEEHSELDEVLPRCLETLADLSERTPNLRLPVGCLVAGRRDGSLVLARLSDESVRVLEPPSLAEAATDSTLAQVTEVLPQAHGDDALVQLLLRSGARDLWSDFHIRKVIPGPEVPSERATALWRDLSGALPGRVGQSVRVVEPLSVRGTLEELAPGSEEVLSEVQSAVHDDVLWLTPAAVDAPELLAPTLERDPARRSAMAAWLAEREWASLPKPLRVDSAPAKRNASSVFDRIRGFFRGASDDAASKDAASEDAAKAAPAKRDRPPKARESQNDEGFFRPETTVRNQLGSSEGWLDRRRTQPDFGFAFSPPRVPAPWLYAPKTIAARFHRRRQSWDLATLTPPPPSAQTGMVVFRGKLPRGGVVLPVPMFGSVQELLVDGESVTPERGAFGQHLLRLDTPAKVILRVALGVVPDLQRAVAAPLDAALASVVPDDELPDAVHDFLHELDGDAPAITQALTIRDFIRDHYRYDPSYLEDPALGRWLARITRGRANAHIAALHAGGDDKHLGAGVCYELNALACELLRRASIPAAIATGWVLSGGALSDPDHLWCVALLEDARGAPLWVPIDAASTRSGRPLRVARRPAGKFRAPKDRRAKAPPSPKWDFDDGESSAGTSHARGTARRKRGTKRAKKRSVRVPRTELLRVIRHLEKLAGQELSEADRALVGQALEDPKEAARLLSRIGRE